MSPGATGRHRPKAVGQGHRIRTVLSTPARLRQPSERGRPAAGRSRAPPRARLVPLGALRVARAPPGALPRLPPARRRPGDHRPHGRLRAPGRVPRLLLDAGPRRGPGVVRRRPPLLPLRHLAPGPRPGSGARHARARSGRLPHRARPLRPRGRPAGHPLHHRGVGLRRGELHPGPVVLRRASGRRPGRAPRRRALARPAALRAGTRAGSRSPWASPADWVSTSTSRSWTRSFPPCWPCSWWSRACRSGGRRGSASARSSSGACPSGSTTSPTTGRRWRPARASRGASRGSRPRGSWPSICSRSSSGSDPARTSPPICPARSPGRSR